MTVWFKLYIWDHQFVDTKDVTNYASSNGQDLLVWKCTKAIKSGCKTTRQRMVSDEIKQYDASFFTQLQKHS